MIRHRDRETHRASKQASSKLFQRVVVLLSLWKEFTVNTIEYCTIFHYDSKDHIIVHISKQASDGTLTVTLTLS